jgi:hypothetical protein
MRAAERSAAGRSPGRFGLVPAFQLQPAPYGPRCEEPRYPHRAGAVAVFAAANPAVAPATRIEGGGWG